MTRPSRATPLVHGAPTGNTTPPPPPRNPGAPPPPTFPPPPVHVSVSYGQGQGQQGGNFGQQQQVYSASHYQNQMDGINQSSGANFHMMDFMRNFCNFYEMARVCSDAYNKAMREQRQAEHDGMQGTQADRDRQNRNSRDRYDRYDRRQDRNEDRNRSRSDMRGNNTAGGSRSDSGASRYPNSATAAAGSNPPHGGGIELDAQSTIRVQSLHQQHL